MWLKSKLERTVGKTYLYLKTFTVKMHERFKATPTENTKQPKNRLCGRRSIYFSETKILGLSFPPIQPNFNKLKSWVWKSFLHIGGPIFSQIRRILSGATKKNTFNLLQPAAALQEIQARTNFEFYSLFLH